MGIYAQEGLAARPPQVRVFAALAVHADAAVGFIARNAPTVEDVAAALAGIVAIGAGPHGHANPVAVSVLGTDVVRAELVGDDAHLVHHVLVAAESARGEHNGFGRVVPHVLAVFCLCDNAGNAPALILNQFHGCGVVLDLSARFGIQLHHGRNGDFRSHGVGRRLERRLIGGVHRCRGVPDSLGTELLANGVDHDVEALLLHLLLVPVDEGSSVVGPLANEVLIDFSLAVADEVLDNPFLVDLDPQILLDFAVQGVNIAGVNGACPGLLDNERLRTQLGELERPYYAGIASAHHNDVVFLGSRNLIGHRCGLVENRGLCRAGLLSCGRELLGCGTLRGASGQGAHSGERACSGGSGKEAAAGKIRRFFHDSSFVSARSAFLEAAACSEE